MLSKDREAISTPVLRNGEAERAAAAGTSTERRGNKEARQTERADAFLWELIIPLPQKLIMLGSSRKLLLCLHPILPSSEGHNS